MAVINVVCEVDSWSVDVQTFGLETFGSVLAAGVGFRSDGIGPRPGASSSIRSSRRRGPVQMFTV